MRAYWSQAAMLLLGITLTVGVYEGRRLVKNTAKAITAATSMTASVGKRGRDRDRDRSEEVESDDGLGIAAIDDGDPTERKRRGRRSTSYGADRDPTDIARIDKVNALRIRQRQRLQLDGRAAVPPTMIPGRPEIHAAGVPAEELDTAIEEP